MWKFRDMGIKKKIQGIQKFGDLEIGQLRDPGIQKSGQFRNLVNSEIQKIGDLGKSEIRGSQKSKEDRSPRKSEIQKIRESGEVQGSGNSGIQRVLGI